MSVQEQLSQAQARVENIRSEKDIIKSSEQRLQAEIDSMRRERHTQTMLMANLQAIQVCECLDLENELSFMLPKGGIQYSHCLFNDLAVDSDCILIKNYLLHSHFIGLLRTKGKCVTLNMLVLSSGVKVRVHVYRFECSCLIVEQSGVQVPA